MKISGCSEVSIEDAEKCMVCHSSDPEFQILSDDGFIESVKEKNFEKEDELNVEDEADSGPSTSKEFTCVETALKWMERKPESGHTELLTLFL